ncbi:DUF4244 domain-containing protein [Pseudarthrobacter sp. NamE2]|uniref:DUF4244 domain-containing protein n=1 Tax=Pseudarthrobacter sp. NamE2 TaxID=2576838 RepID=UPI0010FD3A93|nr:DUF4244 domain-containing protein [Pseudarthrobacter sp. NamE2]TLM84371.1 DUF4244 domain-containing protein [Pseudarthrobacter sp. NamE2]
MSMNHHRRYYAGSAVPAASRSGGPVRSGNRRRDAHANTGGTLPGNVVELYPGASLPPKHRSSVRLAGSEAGMATAEYAIATLAAVGLAGLLVFILRSEEVRGFLLTLIRTALALP